MSPLKRLRRRRAGGNTPLGVQSLMRCFNSQTRSAASKSALVRVRVPAAAISRSGLARGAEVAVALRVRPRFWVLDLRARLALGAVAVVLFIITSISGIKGLSNFKASVP